MYVIKNCLTQLTVTIFLKYQITAMNFYCFRKIIVIMCCILELKCLNEMYISQSYLVFFTLYFELSVNVCFTDLLTKTTHNLFIKAFKITSNKYLLHKTFFYSIILFFIPHFLPISITLTHYSTFATYKRTFDLFSLNNIYSL